MLYVTSQAPNAILRNTILLTIDTWDDYGFKTTFYATYFDDQARPSLLGCVKIAKIDEHDQEILATYSVIPHEFNSLPEGYISLWQSATDYNRVRNLQDANNINVFADLRDIACDLEIYERYKGYRCVNDSLMRGISLYTMKKQFHRIAWGEDMLKEFSFEYRVFNHSMQIDDAILKFKAEPNSLPPTNVHCLIGENGSGKTTIIKSMIESICDRSEFGQFNYFNVNSTDYFESVVCVSFSPFDDYEQLELLNNVWHRPEEKTKMTYIGVKKRYTSEENNEEINILEYIENKFIESYVECLGNKKKKEDLVAILDSIFTKRGIDPIGCDLEPLKNATNIDENTLKALIDNAKNAFANLSAGYKSVLSILTRCVDKVAEKTILFFDEPENHLHPTLLSDLIRCISWLLSQRNGVAIISTHSPIVLQEVPSSCVWRLRRIDDYLSARRLDIETFGANIGTLTNIVFRHELLNSGFIALLEKEVDKNGNYESIVERFGGNLGEDAKSALRVMIANREEEK